MARAAGAILGVLAGLAAWAICFLAGLAVTPVAKTLWPDGDGPNPFDLMLCYWLVVAFLFLPALLLGGLLGAWVAGKRVS